MAPTQVLLYESQMPDARAMLGEATFQAEWALGQSLTLEQAMAPTQVLLYESQMPDARAMLGEATFQAEWALGQALTLEQASEYARQVS